MGSEWPHSLLNPSAAGAQGNRAMVLLQREVRGRGTAVRAGHAEIDPARLWLGTVHLIHHPVAGVASVGSSDGCVAMACLRGLLPLQS